MFIEWETAKVWDYTKLHHSFPGANTITHNYAQSDQDIFVLGMLDGLTNGTYLEIGSAWPEHISNTALLERQFNWQGVSIENSYIYLPMWQEAKRTNTCINADALKIDFTELLATMPGVIDYLSLDCDPSDVTYKILTRIPFDQYQFKVITFEHECYREGPAIKIASRNFLSNLGYELVGSNISHMGIATDYEDWWVHPDLVPRSKIDLYKNIDDSIKDHQKYLYSC
jgi:hypothetical protein